MDLFPQHVDCVYFLLGRFKTEQFRHSDQNQGKVKSPFAGKDIALFLNFLSSFQQNIAECFADFFFTVHTESFLLLNRGNFDICKPMTLDSHSYHTNCNSLMLPLEFAATTIFDFPLQHTLETNCPLSSTVSCPEIGSMEPNLCEVIGIGRDL